MTAPVGLIAGTGFARLPLTDPRPQRLNTQYGAVQATAGTWPEPVLFVPRHGPGHAVPPHRVNYRALIAGLAEAGCRDVFAVNVVGGITVETGSIVIVDDFLDFTKNREHTFHNGASGLGSGQVVHVDVQHAYHPALRAELLAAADECGTAVIDGGVYACFGGPRFESPAEIAMAAALGAAVVGMTSVPECTLAVEAGLRYAAISLVVNPAAGLTDEPVSLEEIDRVLAQTGSDLTQLLDTVLRRRATTRETDPR